MIKKSSGHMQVRNNMAVSIYGSLYILRLVSKFMPNVAYSVFGKLALALIQSLNHSLN